MERLNIWIKNYKTQYDETSSKDMVKLSTFREATTRLKMLLDDSDFDGKDFRMERRNRIAAINQMVDEINGL